MKLDKTRTDAYKLDELITQRNKMSTDATETATDDWVSAIVTKWALMLIGYRRLSISHRNETSIDACRLQTTEYQSS